MWLFNKGSRKRIFATDSDTLYIQIHESCEVKTLISKLVSKYFGVGIAHMKQLLIDLTDEIKIFIFTQP